MRKLVSNEQFKIDASKDLVAYIDEAGDEGFSLTSSKWFLAGCIVMEYDQFQTAKNNLDTFQKDIGRKWENIHFKDLPHNRRKDMCAYIAKSKYTFISSCFSKFQLNDDEKYLCSYPSMYFVAIKNLVERVSWHTAQSGHGRVHIMIANRNKVKAEDLRNYLFIASKKALKNLTYFDKLGNIVIGNQSEYGIKIADCVASSMFQLLEPQGVANMGERTFYDICIKGRFYNSKHSTYGGIWNNGLRCTPRDKTLIDSIDSGILTEELL